MNLKRDHFCPRNSADEEAVTTSPSSWILSHEATSMNTAPLVELSLIYWFVG